MNREISVHIVMGIATAAVVLLCGCSAVVTPYPVGSAPAPDAAETLQGIWKGEENLVWMRHVSNGVCSLVNVEYDKESFKTQTHTFMLRRTGPALYANLLAAPKKKAPQYIFALLETSDNQTCTIVPPRVPVFAAAVRNGALAGIVVSDDEVTITGSLAQLEQYLAAYPATNIWNNENSTTLTRLQPAAGR